MTGTSEGRLSDFCSVFNGKTPSKKEQRTSGFPVLKIKDITEDSRFVGKFDSYVEAELAEKYSHKTVTCGDTLILNAAHNADYVGSKVYFAQSDVEGSLATGEWLLIRPDRDVAVPKYVHYWVLSKRTKLRIRELVRGIHLYPRDVADIPVKLPALPEQERITAILVRADRLRRLRRYALELSEGFLKSVFLEMFGGVNVKNWPGVDIASLAKESKNSIRTGPFGSNLLHSEFSDDATGVMVLGIDNVVQNRFLLGKPRHITHTKYSQLKRYTVYPGDVLVSIMGTVGRCAIVPQNIPLAINTKHLFCITLDKSKCLPSFLKANLLLNPDVLFQMGVSERGAIMAGLNATIIKSLELHLPPIDIQRKFDQIDFRFRILQARHREAIRQADHLFDTLLHRAFRGEL